MNSKQVVGILGIFALLVVLIYPAFAIGSISVVVGSSNISKADHVYVVINDVWAHRAGQASPAGWELVWNKSTTVDLVSLANSTLPLGKGSVSAVQFDMVKIDVGNVSWVYNKTTTLLEVESTEIPTNIAFSVTPGKVSTITLVLTGHEEALQGTKFFVTELNATSTLQA